MAAIKGRMKLEIEIVEQHSDTDLGAATRVHKALGPRIREWSSGTGTDQIDRVYSDTMQLAAATQSKDMSGSLASKLDGTTVTFARVKGLYVRNKSTTDTLTVSGNGVSAFCGGTSPTLVLRPGEEVCFACSGTGHTVTNSTQDTLTFDPSSATFEADVIIWGTSA